MKKSLLFLSFLFLFFIGYSSPFTYISPPPSGPGGVGSTDGSSNLKLWLKADAGITADGNDLVSTWADQSGNGFDVDQSNMNKRPLFQSAGLNGQASLFFNGEGSGSLDNFLNNNSDNLTTSGNARTTFIIGRMNKCAGQGGTLLASRRSSSVHRAMIYLSPIDGLLYVYSDGDMVANDAIIDLSLYDDVQASFLFTQISNGTGNQIEQRLNGASAMISQVGSVSAETGSDGFTVGLSEDGNQLPWSGQISEIIVYDRVLTNQEILDVEAYLQSKYPSSSTNLTSINTIAQTETGSGYALNFDGTDDRIVMGDELDMGANDFTLEAWVYTEAGSFVESDLVLEHGKRVISKGGGESFAPQGAGYGIRLEEFEGDKQALFFVNSNSLSLGVFAGGLEDDKWYHIACVREGNEIRIYVNGILKGTNNRPSILNVNNDSYFSLGCLTRLPNPGPSPDYNEHFKGSMDEIRIWKTALSQSDIRDYMCSKLTEKHPHACYLAAYYRMDTGSGSMISDLDRGTDTNISGANWTLSSAPIGDASINDYNGNSSAVLLADPDNSTENLSAALNGGTADGIHAYFVDEAPNSTTGATGIGSNDRYFGVHVINGNAALYDVIYDYTGNPYVNASNEATLLLLKRDNNADASWEDAMATLNNANNWLLSVGESTEYVLGSSGAILPVELVNLEAKVKEEKSIRISWATTSEQDNKGFELQRSSDGENFTTISWIDGQGNSSEFHTYDFDDFDIKKGVNYFYRLKQINFDASSMISEIVSAKINALTFQGQVFPNPLRDELQIYFTNPAKEQNLSINIYDSSGKLSWRQEFIELPEKLNQSLTFLSKGLYLVVIKDRNGHVIWSDKIVL